MSTPVEQIKSRLSIVDVVGTYIKLTKAGGSFKALCPFHNEKSPSFNVSPSRDAYYCFGCNRGGDIFSFVQEIEGIEFVDALKILAGRAGVELKRENIETKSARERLQHIMEEVTLFYEAEFAKNSAVKEYLIGRGLTEKTIRDFRIGYAPNEWRLAYDHLRHKGFADDEIERAGITKGVEKGVSSSSFDAVRGAGLLDTKEAYSEYGDKGATPRNEKMRETRRTYYDRLRGRVVFPIFDVNGHVVAFSGRVFGAQKNQDGSDVAKYINSPETPLYDKSSILFGYDRAKMDIRKQNFCILVEGQMDLIMSHQAGAINTVAVSGTALTEKHLALLKRISDNLVFAFDADDAGLAATGRAFGVALGLGMSVRVASIPDGKDPADYILHHGSNSEEGSISGWAQVIANSKHIIDFYLSSLGTRGYDPREYRTEVEKKVLPLILAMQSKIEQAHFIVEVARKLGVSENAVWEEVKRLKTIHHTIVTPQGGEEKPDVRRNTIKTRRQLVEEEIISILLWQEGHKEPAIDIVLVRKTYEERFERYAITPMSPDDELMRSLIIKAEHTYEHGPGLNNSIEEMLDSLESEVLKERQAELLKKLSESESKGEKEETKRYLMQYQEITPRLIAIEDRRLKRESI